MRLVSALLLGGMLLTTATARLGVQPGSEGGVLVGDGKHGSIMPSPGRVRSRNKTMADN